MISMERLAQIRKFVQDFCPLPDAELAHVAVQLSPRQIKRGEFLIREGERTDEIAFIHQGLFSRHYLTEKGQCYIKGFGTENSLVAPYADLMRGLPSRFYIEALEDSMVSIIHFGDFKKNYDRHPAWERLARRIAENLFIEVELREYQLLTMSASERYAEFRKSHPSLESRVTLHQIASYLGITPVSLSRIRSNPDRSL